MVRKLASQLLGRSIIAKSELRSCLSPVGTVRVQSTFQAVARCWLPDSYVSSHMLVLARSASSLHTHACSFLQQTEAQFDHTDSEFRARQGGLTFERLYVRVS